MERKEYDDLKEQLRKFSDSYYNDSVSLVTDGEYDNMFNRLKEIEKEHPEWVSDTPTQEVGALPKGNLPKIKHPNKLLSLDNVFSANALDIFLSGIQKTLGVNKLEYSIEPKYDGLTLVATYDEGVLTSIVTRGDGEIGEDVSHNVEIIKGLPKSLTTNATIIVRGEVLMTFDDFNAYNTLHESLGKNTLSNPRNGASGILRRLENDGNKWLTFVPYDIIETKWSTSNFILSQSLMYKKLLALGFTTNKELDEFMIEQHNLPGCIFTVCENIESTKQHIVLMEKIRNLLPFPCDGAVVKVHDFNTRYSLGNTFRAPKHSIAYKFKPEEATSYLRGIDLQVGRTGVLTPVARIDPVDVCGVTVSNVTLHNAAYIKSKDIRIGDKIVISRRGDVIPQIEYVIVDARESDLPIWEMPKTCPCCNSEVIPYQSYHICTNGIHCPDQRLLRINHYCTKPAMNIIGLAENTLKTFIEHKLVETLKDLYSIKKEDIMNIDGMGELTAENLLVSIKRSKGLPLQNFIYALGIEGVGVVTAKNLSKYFKNYENFRKATKDQLLSIKDIGEILANEIVDYLQREGDELDELASIVKPAGLVINANGPFSNKLICFTGKFLHSRKYLEELVITLGGETTSTLNKSVNYLIVGEDSSSKLDKAKKFGIECKPEDWLLSFQKQ